MNSSARRSRRTLTRTFLSLFIVWHLAAVTLWLLPDSALTGLLRPAVRPYMTLTSFMQGWDMFTPNPSHMDVYVEARVTYADGYVRSWTFPRMSDLGYAERYRRERFRKLIENAHQDSSAFLWPSLVRYAARCAGTRDGNPPVSVLLVRHFLIVPPPGQPVGDFQTYPFYQAPVSPEDLR